jgi:serine/threonine protein kinase
VGSDELRREEELFHAALNGRPQERMGFLAEACRGDPAMRARMLRRFEREGRVLGRLQHPGIARILDSGTEDLGQGSQPHFAMELVAGRSLTLPGVRGRLRCRGLS